MNQPRFKFGDKVKHKLADAQPFVVSKCSYSIWSNKFYIGEYEKEVQYYEEDCELYQEPQKKKLYAYRIRGTSEIVMSSMMDREECCELLIRTKGLDIEYPEK